MEGCEAAVLAGRISRHFEEMRSAFAECMTWSVRVSARLDCRRVHAAGGEAESILEACTRLRLKPRTL